MPAPEVPEPDVPAGPAPEVPEADVTPVVTTIITCKIGNVHILLNYIQLFPMSKETKVKPVDPVDPVDPVAPVVPAVVPLAAVEVPDVPVGFSIAEENNR